MDFVLALVGMFVGFGAGLVLTIPLMSVEKAINGPKVNGISFFFGILGTLSTQSVGFYFAAVVYSMRGTHLPVSFVLFVGICRAIHDIARINKYSLAGSPWVLREMGYLFGGLLALIVAWLWLVGIRVL